MTELRLWQFLLSVTICWLVVSSQLTETEKQEILDRHNVLRASEGSSDMTALVWNDELATMAQDWSDGCVFAHGGRSVPGDSFFYNVGQNMWWSSSDSHLGAGMVVSAVDMWYDEKADYTYENNTCADTKVCGHYTQIVWATTTDVGCGYTDCDTDGQIIVCNYYPPGNWIGESPYQEGTPCSACPTDYDQCVGDLCAKELPAVDVGHCSNAVYDPNTCSAVTNDGACSVSVGWGVFYSYWSCGDVNYKCWLKCREGFNLPSECVNIDANSECAKTTTEGCDQTCGVGIYKYIYTCSFSAEPVECPGFCCCVACDAGGFFSQLTSCGDYATDTPADVCPSPSG